jgi:putative endonuclease
MYYVYLLYSEKIDRYYIGQTNNLEDRLIRHNQNRCRSTKNKGPWKLIGYRTCEYRYEAVQLERKFKSIKNIERLIYQFYKT